MSDSSKKKIIKEESKILDGSEAKDNVAEGVSSSQGPAQESHALNSSSNSLKKSSKVNKVDKKEKEEESDIEYDDVYVVEERTVPTAEIDNQEDEDMNEELSLSLSSEDDNFEIINSDYDKIKLASEKSKRKLEKKKRYGKIGQNFRRKNRFYSKNNKKRRSCRRFYKKFFHFNEFN